MGRWWCCEGNGNKGGRRGQVGTPTAGNTPPGVAEDRWGKWWLLAVGVMGCQDVCLAVVVVVLFVSFLLGLMNS